MLNLVTRAAAAAVALTVAAGLASCAPAADPAPAPSKAAEPTPATSPTPRNYVAEAEAAAAAEAAAKAEARQAEYTAAVATFPLAMPGGYTFPETAPAGGFIARPGSGSGSATAYAVWRCSVAQAARDAHVLNGDDASAQSLLAQIAAVSDDDLPGNGDWVQMVLPESGVSWGSLEGETGMCYFWLRPHGRWNV